MVGCWFTQIWHGSMAQSDKGTCVWPGNIGEERLREVGGGTQVRQPLGGHPPPPPLLIQTTVLPPVLIHSAALPLPPLLTRAMLSSLLMMTYATLPPLLAPCLAGRCGAA